MPDVAVNVIVAPMPVDCTLAGSPPSKLDADESMMGPGRGGHRDRRPRPWQTGLMAPATQGRVEPGGHGDRFLAVELEPLN